MPVPVNKKVKSNRRKPKPELVESLTPLQQAFVAVMAADPQMNASAAVLKAGYKVKKSNASAFASNLLANPVVKKALDHAIYKRLWGYNVTADRVIREVAALALSSSKDFFAPDKTPLHPLDMPEEAARACKSVRVSYTENMDEVGNFNQVRNVEVQPYDKTAPLQMLMRHLGIDGTTKIQGQLDANISGGVSVQLDLGQVLLELEKSRVVDADTYKITESKEQASGQEAETRDADADPDGG
jgi:phage terminase small subunit